MMALRVDEPPVDTVVANLGLVHMWASKLARPEVERADLVQEGVIGLIRAAEGFDAERGIKFSTYASFWIRKAMQTGALRARDRVGVGAETESERRAVQLVVDETSSRSGERVSDDVIAERTGYAPAKVRRLRELPRVEALGDELSGSTPCSTSGLDDALLRVSVHCVVRSLAEPMQSVVRLNYGLGCAPQPQTRIAQTLGLSVRQVRELKQDALGILRPRLAEDT